MTDKQLAAIERARHAPAEIVEITPQRKRRRSLTMQERIELIQGHWADKERERLIRTWGR